MQEDESTDLKYRVIKIEKIAAPVGLSGDDWHRYIIGQGSDKIVGRRPGTLQAVTEHAETAADFLNSRSDKISASYTYTPRKWN